MVRDSSGAVVADARITLKNVDTGISRAISTDADGRYSGPQLGLGNYEVTAEAAGFQTQVRKGITLTVGREAVVDFAIQVGALTEKITVTGEAPLIETTNSTVASLVDERAMRDLPLNGRSFADLTAIQPGAVTSLGTNTSVYSGGTKISINGARGQQSLYLLDGLDISAPYMNSTPASVMNQLLGVDTIREFSVLTNNYGAQYGRAIGGVINAVTRSGTNQVHGSAFEFLRNSALDAKNFFDAHDQPIHPFKRNQFGATAGGPIAKDTTFFFLSYEGLRERLGLSDLGIMLTQEAREQGILRDTAGNITSVIPVNPDIVPFLKLLPLPNGASLGGGLGEFRGSRTQTGGEDYGMGRLDRRLGDKDSFFGRFTIDQSSVSVPEFQLIPGGGALADDGGYRFLSLVYTRVLSSSTLNTLSAGLARNNVGEQQLFSATGLDPRLSGVPGDPLLGVSSTGVGGISIPQTLGAPYLGQSINPPMRFIDNTFDYADTLIWTVGRHSLNLGANFKRYQMNELLSTYTHGQLTFGSVPNLLQGRLTQMVAVGANPDVYRGYRQTYASLFFQDDFKLLPTLTLNIGLRWERVTAPSEVNGKLSTVKDVLHDSGFFKPDKLFELRDAFKGFAPRFGFAWSPLKNQTTVFRGGFGMFREIPLEYIYSNVLNAPPYAQVFNISNPPFPNPFQGATGASGQPIMIAYSFKYPYSYQWNLGIQRQLAKSFVAEVSYIGTRGLNLVAVNNPNQPVPQKVGDRWFTPLTATSPNPNFSAVRLTSNVGNAWYNALQLTGEKRFSGGWQINASYTWSKNLDSAPIALRGGDTVAGEAATYVVYNVYDIKSDKALSTLDSRHNFTSSYSYELPFGPQKFLGSNTTGLAAGLLGGWQINGILVARTGLPQTVLMTFDNSRRRPPTISDRPDLLPGKSNNPVLGGPDHYYDVSSFTVPAAGFFGNTARNTVTRPGLFTWNFSIVKKTNIRERRSLEFRAELFNLFNRPNFGLPVGTVFTSAAGTPNPSAGKITSTSTTSRQIQFGLKYVF